MHHKLVIFGASSGGEKVYYTLKSIGIDVKFFVDNDANKWGQTFHNRLIKSPEELIGQDIHIIIAAEEFQEAIEEQLAQLNLLDKLILKENYLLAYTLSHLNILDSFTDINITQKKHVFIELLEGCEKDSGGILSWSLTVADGFQHNGIPAHIISTSKYGFPESKETMFFPIETEYDDYWNSVIRLTKFFAQHMPCTIISNKQLQMFYAGLILKNKFPDQVTLVTVIHSDLVALYRRADYLFPYVDKILCTTLHMKEVLLQQYHIPMNKLAYKEMPLSSAYRKPIIRTVHNESLKIGWGGRLVKPLKRADFIIKLIIELEKLQINYLFFIAGEGSYFNRIQDYIKSENLEQKVHLLGQLKRKDMPSFWRNMDIFISLSDKEGAGLSMLEAIACGAVPVTTAYTSTKEFIRPGESGYIVPIGDYTKIAEWIAYLSNHREQLCYLANNASLEIQVKCSITAYIKYLCEFVI